MTRAIDPLAISSGEGGFRKSDPSSEPRKGPIGKRQESGDKKQEERGALALIAFTLKVK